MLTGSTKLMKTLHWPMGLAIANNIGSVGHNAPKSVRYHHSCSSPVKLSHDIYENTVDIYNSIIPPLLIQHGLFGSKQNWRSLCKKLSASVPKIVTVDARNHGSSEHSDEMNYFVMRDDTIQLIDQLQLDKVVLLGHSMGGKSAMVTALTQPERLSALIVVDVSPRLSPSASNIGSIIEAMKNLNLDRNVPLPSFRRWADTQLSRAVQDTNTRHFLSTNLMTRKGRKFWRINLESIDKNIGEIMEFPYFESTYQGPTLFIHGENSSYLSEADKPEIKRLFPNHDIVQVKGAGHWVHSDKPRDFLKIVMSFLEDTYL